MITVGYIFDLDDDYAIEIVETEKRLSAWLFNYETDQVKVKITELPKTLTPEQAFRIAQKQANLDLYQSMVESYNELTCEWG